jgi:hypothetical protein
MDVSMRNRPGNVFVAVDGLFTSLIPWGRFNRIKSYKKAKCNLLPGKLNFCPDVCCRRRGISPSEYAEGIMGCSFRGELLLAGAANSHYSLSLLLLLNSDAMGRLIASAASLR